MGTNSPATPKLDEQLIHLLRQDFLAADFTLDGITDFLGKDAFEAYLQEDLDSVRYTVSHSSSPLALLIKFFLLHDSCTSGELDTMLPRVKFSGALMLRIAKEDSANYSSTFNVQPYFSDDCGNAWFFSDLTQIQTSQSLNSDHVLGVSHASRTLTQAVIRTPVDTALDLGCGCGIQTLHLINHAQQLTVTDISHRALELTQFNLLLNNVNLEKVTFKQGSLFDPIENETFDLIISNPPFVITPPKDKNYSYRETGLVGDAFVQKLVAKIPQHLNTRGIAQFIANWEVKKGYDWKSTFEMWELPACTMRVYLREILSPMSYAKMWAHDADLFEDTSKLIIRYLADFEHRDIKEIAFGFFTLTKNDTPRVITENLSNNSLVQPIWSDLEQDIVRAKVTKLQEQKLKVASDVTEERFYIPGNEHPNIIQLRQGGGLARHTQVSSELAAFVGACDGELGVNEICAGLAHLLGLESTELEETLLPTVLKLYQEGYLTLLSE
ncbi:MAG: methyltransferase [Micrococcaceae bacterium]